MSATHLTITNPLVKYRSLLATKAISPDNGQLRLALHLQKLYDRLKDYEPQIEYSQRLNKLSRTVENAQDAPPPQWSSSWRSLLAAKERRDSLALTRRLTDHESAIEMRSPRGLMLHGEVGTGKSMLVDLFADCLPTRKKTRLHFSTFMLQTFARLEAYRQAASLNLAGEEHEYSLLRLAREMIEQHPILFLDEFQMPDRVASKILTNLMTSFFHLGGVLIATSNRMPEELAKASGVEFAPPPSRLESLGWRLGRKRMPDRFAGPSEFAAFLDVLRARCEVWEMEGGRDYRRLESGRVKAPERVEEVDGDWRIDEHQDYQHSVGMAGWPDDSSGMSATEEVVEGEAAELKAPRFYQVSADHDGDVPMSYETMLRQATGSSNVAFEPAFMRVYGRQINVPRAYKGVTKWTFDELCKSNLGPADYSTLASTFHTIILTDVPILTWLMKNEARRFITLLDALYECRCKLYISATAGPDDLFFPDELGKEDNADAVYAETFSEAYQDATAPFRPNILSQNPNYVETGPEPDYTHARLAGLLNADAIEDDPPNKPHRSKKDGFSRSFGRTDSEMERGPIDPDEVRYTAAPRPDFSKSSRFTGEDERFAYKRAQSRLWEMCGAKWWAREEEGWHRPLPAEVRRWERSVADSAEPPPGPRDGGRPDGDIVVGDAAVDETRDARSFKQPTASPFRSIEEDPPKFEPSHIWSLGLWGKRAGAWGKGTEALKDKEDQKR